MIIRIELWRLCGNVSLCVPFTVSEFHKWKYFTFVFVVLFPALRDLLKSPLPPPVNNHRCVGVVNDGNVGTSVFNKHDCKQDLELGGLCLRVLKVTF